MKWKESSKSNTLDSDQFEPDQSGLSQEEEDNLSKAMLHLLAHGNDYIYPPASSCSFGFPADDHALWFWAYYNVDKVVQGPCAIGSESAAIVKKWSLFDQSLNFFLSGERDGKIIVQSPREVLVNGAKQWSNALIANFLSKSPPLYVFQRTADKLWSRKGSMVIRFLAPEEKYSRKCVVQTDVGTKDVDALNSSSGTPDVDIGNVGGSVIYEDNVVQANVVQPVDQGIKLVEIEGGINPVDAIGFSAAVSNNVVSIESTICVPCVEVKSVTLLFLLRSLL
ncbi:hypothetical protein V6N11_034493 [Hibiscus sabdariffa]|uniref:Uncharacterized protein n=2 Tax=Hibiscus sabdariffa TaxID=183260 RepID=A0ABR2NEP2_9ROSI